MINITNNLKKYYLSIEDDYNNEKVTIFRDERKLLNSNLFIDEIWLDSSRRTETAKYFTTTIFNPILNELCKYNDFSSTNMLAYEIFSSIFSHNLQSLFILFRAFLISFVLEHRNYSITQQKNKLNTFEKTLNELEIIFNETNHFKYGEMQFKIDAKYENIDISHINFSELNCAGSRDYKELIQYCNKITHCEIRFKNNNDTKSIEMAYRSKGVISFTIALVINIIRSKIKSRNI